MEISGSIDGKRWNVEIVLGEIRRLVRLKQSTISNGEPTPQS